MDTDVALREMTSEELLLQWLRFGWKFRKVGLRPRKQQDWYHERIKYELNLITKKDFTDFFLATSEMVRWAKDYRGPEAPTGIPMGPGRGSVAASVVAWMLRITEVDPIRYPNLLFERFIDVTRSDPPDIDLDISDEHRYLVRQHMEEKYGADCVGTVANFVRYRGKNSLADVARVYNIPIWAKEAVSALVIERSTGDSRFDASLEDTVKLFPAAAEVFNKFPDFWKACRLEGNMQNMSIHAAGLVVTPTPLTDVCAVYDRDGRSVISIDKYDAESAGLLKMDILGLSTMGIIARCLEMCNMTLGDLYEISDEDPEALEIFRAGDVTGIFQFEGRATRLVNRDVRPDNFGEVADINALSRPGPLFSGTTAEYADVKHGRREASRYHPIVDDITKFTKGQIIYQEQVLRVVREVGGFGWEQANAIRRIIAKKHGEAAFNLSRQDFLDGAAKLHGMPESTSGLIWKRIVTSSTYAFVYAHSVSYSMLALWCAYLKAHHPLEFYAANLAKTGDKEKQFQLMKDALAHGIEIKAPKVGVSRRSWMGHHDLVRGRRELIAGWQQIPGIGEITSIRMEEENDRMPFGSFYDMDRVHGVGPKTVEKIIEFASSNDPFGLKVTGQRIRRVKRWIETQSRVPMPTHDGAEIADIYVEDNRNKGRGNWNQGPVVIYAGIVRHREYKDIVEDKRARTGAEAKDILAELTRPDLVKYCSLRCYDETDEEVYLRINRFKFPWVRKAVDSIAVNHDVVICLGNRVAGFGTPIAVDKIWVIDPDD